MYSETVLVSQLQRILPTTLQQDAPALAKIFNDLLTQKISSSIAQNALSSIPRVNEITRSLYGKTINYYDSLLSFGSNNQFGDVSVGDIVGGDKYHFDITLISPQKETSRFSLLITRMSDLLTEDMAAKKRIFWPVIVLGSLSVILACSPFIPSWIPAAGIITAFISHWCLIEGHRRLGWTIWWISISIILLLSALHIPLLSRSL